MYTAKAGGKNCARVFARDMHLAAVERLDLEAHLRGAAGRGELMVHYQPIFELSSGRITAVEALVRWQHPERGPLGPLSFIPFAEETGLIDEIGHQVLEHGVRGGGRLDRRGRRRGRARGHRQRLAPPAARHAVPGPGRVAARRRAGSRPTGWSSRSPKAR